MSSLQDHIHLSATLGSAPENSPTYTWKVRGDSRAEIPVFTAEIDEGLQGDVFAHVTKRGGIVVRRTDYAYVIKVQDNGVNTTEELKDILKGMTGQIVYLVDNYHVADGSDHTSYVQTVLFQGLGEFRADVLNLSFYWVPIRLVNTVTSP